MSASPSPTPTPEPTDQPTASPSSGRSADDSPAPGDPGKAATPQPTTSKAPSATPEPQGQTTPKASKAGVSALLVPPATGNNAVITVKVGGNRTSLTAVGNLAGVTLGFYDTQTGGTPAFTCVSDTDGDCSIIVPDTQPGGANRDHRFWVRQISTASGYYTNPELGTGTTVAADPYRFQTGTQLRPGNTYRSTVDFMISTGTSNNEASGGIWQNSRDNPTFPAKCGINVALVLDLSNSVTDAQLLQLKAAANGFVDALTGTSSQVGTFTFATSAPANSGDTLPLTPVSTSAGATVVKNRISGYNKPGGNAGGTNWDRGIYQVAQSTSTFDVAVVITDGNPTFYGAGEGPGNRTRFREVENGIFSANAIKAENTKVIAFGVGDGIGNSGSGDNLRSISGPTLNSDYYQTTDYEDAGDQLRELALGNCTGSITVVKQVVPATAPRGIDHRRHTGRGLDVRRNRLGRRQFRRPDHRRVTATGTGAANFPLTFTGGATTGPVTLTETLQAGYTLQQVGGNQRGMHKGRHRRVSAGDEQRCHRFHRGRRKHLPGQLHRLQPDTQPVRPSCAEQNLGGQRHHLRRGHPAARPGRRRDHRRHQPTVGSPQSRLHGGRQCRPERISVDTADTVHAGLEPTDQCERDHRRSSAALEPDAGERPQYVRHHECLDLSDQAHSGESGPVRRRGTDLVDSRRCRTCRGGAGPERDLRIRWRHRTGHTGRHLPARRVRRAAPVRAGRRPERQPDPRIHRQLELCRGGQGRHHRDSGLRRRPQRRRHGAVRDVGAVHRDQRIGATHPGQGGR